MKVFSLLFYLAFLPLLMPLFLHETEAKNDNVYIVYMGAASSQPGSLRLDHVRLVDMLLRRGKDKIILNYKFGFSGFAAHLTEEEIKFVARQPGVVSVFPDTIFQLHTTRSWDFLQYETKSLVSENSKILPTMGSDVIIGILDTGIWPESMSFDDNGMDPIPLRWKGACIGGTNFNSSKCNKKLIGARYYTEQTARDGHGHGTHTASTAAGGPAQNASFYGLATGTAKGGSPDSRLAIYKICSRFGCGGAAILGGFDDAIRDGVDVLSLSLGAAFPRKSDYSRDPIAIGAFHAVEKGITVVCSAGNMGPGPSTVVNDAPWILTVGATTIDRDFEADVVLGSNLAIKGRGINFGNIKRTAEYPLVYGQSAKKSSARDVDARNCIRGSLDASIVQGKILLCDYDTDDYSVKDRIFEVKYNGGIGLIVAKTQPVSMVFNFFNFPRTLINNAAAAQIHSYINSTKKPVATILPTVTVTNYKPAPVIAGFSARGPSLSTRNLIKPDIVAPGVNILAAWIGNDQSRALPGKEPPLFNIISGTSMSCPHVSGIAATIKSRNPEWSPSAIRSAIMTTATQSNNMKAPMTTEAGSAATPYDYGAGEVIPSRSLQPGLVYETNIIDYLDYLCYYGYTIKSIRLISSKVPEGFSCPVNSTTDLISDINYPSIAVSKFDAKATKTVKRTVTNVGAQEVTTYTATVDAPSELSVTVTPNKLQFGKNVKKLSYQVTFSSKTSSSLKADVFGQITWTNGKYKVRSPFVVVTSSRLRFG